MSVRPRTLLLLALGVLIVGSLAYVATRSDPVPVDLAEVTSGPMKVTVDADGRTRIEDVYEIAAPIAGTALRSPVRVGDRVIAGETVVARVEPVAPALLDERSRLQAEAAVREAEAGRAVAESRVRQAEEDVSLAESQWSRAQRLVSSGTASVSSLEDAEQRLMVREAALDAARSNLSMAESALARAQAALIEPSENGERAVQAIDIHAPIDGEVLAIPVISERPVQAGTTLLSVGQPADLEIVADLLSSDAVRLSEGAAAAVERWGGDHALEARLLRIDPAARTKISALGIEEQRVDAVFELLSPPEVRDGLGDGYAVFLRIVEWQADDTLQVPLSALWRDGDDWSVFVADGTTVSTRQVEIGRRNERTAQVLSGVEAGERVVVHPSDELGDGVEIVERGALRED